MKSLLECGQNRFILVAYETYDMYLLYTYTYNATYHIYIIPGGIISDHIKEFHEFPFFWALPNKNKSTLFFLSAEFFSPVFFFGPIHRPLIGAFFINKKFSGFRSRWQTPFCPEGVRAVFEVKRRRRRSFPRSKVEKNQWFDYRWGPPDLADESRKGGVQPNDADVKLHHFPRDRGEKKKISEATM